MGLFERLFGRGPMDLLARRAEVRGELARAAQLWAEAGHPEEVARIMILRGDGEIDPRARLVHYVQAVETAPEPHPVHRRARLKRASLVVAMARGGVVSAPVRAQVVEAAADLEALGEHDKAQEAYALVGDREGQARALTELGDVDGLEALLEGEHDKARWSRRLLDAGAEFELLVASGRRREAVAFAETALAADPRMEALRSRFGLVLARRVVGPRVAIAAGGPHLDVVLGEAIVIGRTEGDLLVPSTAISRRHVAIRRRDGGFVVEDLGSRNGVQLRGMDVGGEIAVGPGVELRLGRDVPLRVAPSAVVRGALDVDIAGRRYVAPLGPLRLEDAYAGGAIDPARGWVLDVAADGWVELRTAGSAAPHVDGLALVATVSVLHGDRFAASRGGAEVLRVLPKEGGR